jgi:hypothetical protein
MIGIFGRNSSRVRTLEAAFLSPLSLSLSPPAPVCSMTPPQTSAKPEPCSQAERRAARRKMRPTHGQNKSSKPNDDESSILNGYCSCGDEVLRQRLS